MSEEARILFQTIIERYSAAGSPERGGYIFGAGEMTDAYRELETAGLMQRVFGTVGGVAWRLTETGAERAKQPA
ncbi:MAG: hypothetical protein ABW061_27090 [Polyangiaceae bacterium]